MSAVPLPPHARAVTAYWLVVALVGVGLVVFGAPSWAALLAGMLLAVASRHPQPSFIRPLTGRTLQLGVVALGAGMNLETVWRVGSRGAVLTAASLTVALLLGALLGRRLGVGRDIALLTTVGTAICGGSAIAAVASVTKPKAQDVSVALGVVFVLNAIGLVVFPPIGHALGLSETVFGRWAALAIHDTSSVVGAGLSYGGAALEVATTTKLVRALWIVPLTLIIALVRRAPSARGLRGVKWPWFILGFVLVAALATWVPLLSPLVGPVALVGRRALVLALFLIGLSLSRETLANVGVRPFVHGVVLWIIVGLLSLPLAWYAPD